jgi:hypothetical protein
MRVNLRKALGATLHHPDHPGNIPDTAEDSQYKIMAGALREGDSSAPYFNMTLKRISPSNPNRHIRFPVVGYTDVGGFTAVGYVTITCN